MPAGECHESGIGWGNMQKNGDSELIENILKANFINRSLIMRGVWITLGSICVVFAYIGTFTPGWPTVSWGVAAAFCYAQSSRKLFRWLLQNKLFGGYILDYYKNDKTIPKHAKNYVCVMIIVMATISSIITTALGDPGYGAATICFVALIGVWFIMKWVPTRGVVDEA